MEQGSVLRRNIVMAAAAMAVSIPLEQGSVLRPGDKTLNRTTLDVSIPLEQGSVLRQHQSDS